MIRAFTLIIKTRTRLRVSPLLYLFCCEVKRSLLGYNGEVELKSLISKMAGKVIGKYYLPPQETDGAVEQRMKIAMKLIVVSELRTQTCIEAFLWLQDTGLGMITPRAGDHKLLCFQMRLLLLWTYYMEAKIYLKKIGRFSRWKIIFWSQTLHT